MTRAFTAILQAGIDWGRRLVRQMEVPNRCVQMLAAQEMTLAGERVQQRIDRGECGHLDDSEPDCETEDGQ